MTEAMVADTGGCAVPAVHSEEISESCSLLPALKDSPQPSPTIDAAPSPAAVEDDRSLLAGNNPSSHPLEKAGCVVSEVLVDDHAQETLVLGRCGGKMVTCANPVSGYSAAAEDVDGRVEVSGGESLLEVKKKKLLADLEGGAIFKGKSFLGNVVDGSNGFEESDGPSLKVQLIDDTVLIEPVSVFRNVQNERQQVNGGNVKRNGFQGAGDGKKKRPRRKRKDSVNEKLNRALEPENRGVGGLYPVNGKYSRKELEEMRFLNIVEQRRIWSSIYNGLGAAVVKEYEELACSRNQKNLHQRNCDSSRHPRFGSQAAATAGASSVLGEELSSENVDDELENIEDVDRENLSLGPSCSQEIVGGETPDTVAEEQYDEEDNSDDDYASIQKPAFRIEGEPNFDSGPPEDGWEYLRRVRWEAARIPKVKVAKLDQHKIKKEQSVYMPQIPDIPKCPDHLLPSKTWEDAFLADFSQLRLLLARDEESDDLISHKPQPVTIAHEKDDETQFHLLTENIILENVNHLCPENDDPNGPPDGSDLENMVDHASSSSSHSITDEGNKLPAPSLTPKTTTTRVEDSSTSHPALSAILAMDSVVRVSTLKKRISSAESATTTSLSKNDCLWLFALCAVVDTPLLADTSAAIRGLLRKCACLRAAKSELDDEVVMLNILATICGRFFGQAEC
ncbi:unnamed protein product [Linum trigynum]|uniref:Gem-associated protein 2 n=1 Tax=Linum trigynum TaxID=586398 RepID=A0AAV2D2V8_9ROSI